MGGHDRTMLIIDLYKTLSAGMSDARWCELINELILNAHLASPSFTPWVGLLLGVLKNFFGIGS
jgi:hypothetical protein